LLESVGYRAAVFASERLFLKAVFPPRHNALSPISACPNERLCTAPNPDSVEDRGCGIEDPTRIFGPFFTTKEMGWGVGLSVCRSIIQSHEGELWAESAGDQGTKFWFTLLIGPSRDTAD
jgi:hypothetical protein